MRLQKRRSERAAEGLVGERQGVDLGGFIRMDNL
jgi:hypothetical protein